MDKVWAVDTSYTSPLLSDAKAFSRKGYDLSLSP